MPDVRRPGDPFCEPSYGKDAAITGQLLEEGQRVGDLGRGGSAVQPLGAGMRRHDVPAQRVQLELGERGLDDGGSCLGGAGAGQLAL